MNLAICRVPEENLPNLATQSHKITQKTVPFQPVGDYSGRTSTLHDSRPEAFSDGVFWATGESATACSEAMAQLVQACSEPRL